MAPPSVTADEQFPVEVHVYSQFATSGTVDAQERRRDPGIEGQCSWKQGLNRIAFENTREGRNQHGGSRRRASSPPRIPLPATIPSANPSSSTDVPAFSTSRATKPSAQYLKKALESRRPDRGCGEPGAACLRRFRRTRCVRCRDHERCRSQDDFVAAEAGRRDLCSELGGGFILAGGENTYGKDGYSDTPIEKALPVTFDTKKRPPTIAMVVVIDVSGSMSQGQLTIAKEAAKAPLKSLRNSDRFGVLSFNTGFNWVAPIQYVSNRATTQRRNRIAVCRRRHEHLRRIECRVRRRSRTRPTK